MSAQVPGHPPRAFRERGRPEHLLDGAAQALATDMARGQRAAGSGAHDALHGEVLLEVVWKAKDRAPRRQGLVAGGAAAVRDDQPGSGGRPGAGDEGHDPDAGTEVGWGRRLRGGIRARRQHG
jgi:hypothetical protein